MENNTGDELKVSRQQMLDDYHRVVDNAELVSIQLIKSVFEVKPGFFGDPLVRQGLSVTVDIANIEFSAERGVAMAYLSFEVEARAKRKKLLGCTGDYLVIYEGLAGCDEKAVRAFVSKVATFAAYPYFRSYFATADWAATTQLPPLPVLRERGDEKAKGPAKRVDKA
ncbi:hypothetical protein [Aliihoeflea sp. PC F10.4]